MDERLRQYLEECKKKKLAWEQVAQVMEGSNYSPETLTEAKAWYDADGIAPSPEPVKGIVENKTKRKIGWGGIGVVLGIIVVLLLGGSYGAIYLVGTQKLTIPNQSIQAAVEKVAMTVPGVPRNPKLVLELVTEAHKKVSKSSFEISISGQVDASEIESLLGSKAIDMQIKGFSDMTNTVDPKFFVNLIWGKELDVDVRKPDRMMYVKVNKLPVALYALLGMDPVKMKPLWDNWIGVDVSKPNTSARQILDEAVSRQGKQPEAVETTQDIMDKIMTEDVLPSLKISEEKKDGIPVYKIDFIATPEQINKIAREMWGNNRQMSTNPAETVKSLGVQVWIDKKEMLVLQMNIAGSIEVDKGSAGFSSALTPVLALTSEKQRADVAIVIKMSDFGKDVPVVKPDKFLSPEEFLSEFMKMEPGGLLGAAINPQRQFAHSNNTKRRSDINALLNAVHEYNADNNSSLTKNIPLVPTTISKSDMDICAYLVPTYIAQLPLDPSLGTATPDCKKTYDTGYEISKDKTGKITITAPLAENSEKISVTR